MADWRLPTDFADDPAWDVLSGGNDDLADSLQATWCRLQAISARHRSRGYLPDAAAMVCANGRRDLLDLLATPVLDRPAKLHTQVHECVCLAPGTWWDGAAWRLHPVT